MIDADSSRLLGKGSGLHAYTELLKRLAAWVQLGARSSHVSAWRLRAGLQRAFAQASEIVGPRHRNRASLRRASAGWR